MPELSTRLIIGLGNPGKNYQDTRHNLGFLVVGRLAKQCRFVLKRGILIKGLFAQGFIEGRTTCLFLPLTYMNNSGVAVKELIRRKKIAVENTLVVCDDINLDLGDLRLRPSGSDGGHNGLSSLSAHLKTESFARLRVGVGRPAKKEDVVEYVLSPFKDGEKKELDLTIERAVQCCRVWLSEGTAKTMDQFNKRKENE